MIGVAPISATWVTIMLAILIVVVAAVGDILHKHARATAADRAAQIAAGRAYNAALVDGIDLTTHEGQTQALDRVVTSDDAMRDAAHGHLGGLLAFDPHISPKAR